MKSLSPLLSMNGEMRPPYRLRILMRFKPRMNIGDFKFNHFEENDMDIHECQKAAQNHKNFNLEFWINVPAGRTKCRWIDSFFGLIGIERIEGFVSINQLEQIDPNINCEIIEDDKDSL